MNSKLLLPIGALSAMVLLACADETVHAAHTAESRLNVAAKHHHAANPSIAANTANPYDGAGLDYRHYLFVYKNGNYHPGSYEEVDAIVREITSKPAITLTTIATRELLSGCLDTPDVVLVELLLQSGFSQNAKFILHGLADNYDTLANLPFTSAYDEIATLESAVMASDALSPEEQRTILTLTAITRYSLYHSCCEDTDWEKSVGNIVAALAGALQDNELALRYALITSITGLERIKF